MPSQTEENYLKALFSLSDERGEVSVSDLSGALSVSTPTANSMVKRLSEKGLLHYEKYKPLTLTEKGQLEAALIVRRHRLAEMYLVEKMGFGWEEVHEIAEQLEHIKSAKFFDKMDELMGHPVMDPHGSPIPDKNGHITDRAYQKLSDISEGEKVKLRALVISTADFLNFLNNKGLALGTELEVLTVEDFDQSVTIAYDQHPSVTLSHEASKQLLVEAL